MSDRAKSYLSRLGPGARLISYSDSQISSPPLTCSFQVVNQNSPLANFTIDTTVNPIDMSDGKPSNNSPQHAVRSATMAVGELAPQHAVRSATMAVGESAASNPHSASSGMMGGGSASSRCSAEAVSMEERGSLQPQLAASNPHSASPGMMGGGSATSRCSAEAVSMEERGSLQPRLAASNPHSALSGMIGGGSASSVFPSAVAVGMDERGLLQPPPPPAVPSGNMAVWGGSRQPPPPPHTAPPVGMAGSGGGFTLPLTRPLPTGRAWRAFRRHTHRATLLPLLWAARGVLMRITRSTKIFRVMLGVGNRGQGSAPGLTMAMVLVKCLPACHLRAYASS